MTGQTATDTAAYVYMLSSRSLQVSYKARRPLKNVLAGMTLENYQKTLWRVLAADEINENFKDPEPANLQ